MHVVFKKIAAESSAAILIIISVLLLCLFSCEKQSVPEGMGYIPYTVIEDNNPADVLGTNDTNKSQEVLSQNNQSHQNNKSQGYVLNTSSKRIHYPDCPGVKKIADNNYDTCDDYDTAVSLGYVPCGICNK